LQDEHAKNRTAKGPMLLDGIEQILSTNQSKQKDKDTDQP
jgi:hypothetical protein